MNRTSIITTCSAAMLVCAIAWLIRAPLIYLDLPFIYQEDDGHHFNRSVEMFKNRSLDPVDYFNKPSLHFYLRLPINFLAVRDAIAHGELSSAKEIRTKDPYGLSHFAYTTSHPRILIWNRAWSVCLSVILIAVTFLLSRQLLPSTGIAIFAAFIPTLSPEVFKNSHIVGVDVLMGVMCLLSTTSAVLFFRSRPQTALLLSAIFAGMAISSKYNAAPIVLVPLLVAFLSAELPRKLSHYALALLLPSVTFLLTSPYILVHWNEAVQDILYERWHYAEAGHAGHSATPGFPQALFYSDWLLTDGVGIPISFLALLGFFPMLLNHDRRHLLFAAFPLSYFALMVFQKTNFTRNMVCIVPYIAVFAAYGMCYATSALRKSGLSSPITTLTSVIALWPLLVADLVFMDTSLRQGESRRELLTWISSKPQDTDIAVSGELQMPIDIFSAPGVDAFNPATSSASDLLQMGYSYLAFVPGESSIPQVLMPYIQEEATIPGSNSDLRVPKDPPIQIVRFDPKSNSTALALLPASKIILKPDPKAVRLGCESGQEQHCWLTHRHSQLILENSGVTPVEMRLRISSPWHDQLLIVEGHDGKTLAATKLTTAGDTHALTVHATDFPLEVFISQVHSPKQSGVGSDTRRLGVRFQRD